MLQHDSGIIDLNIITVIRKDTGESYVFVYKRGKEIALIWQFMKFAMCRNLSFDWNDAAQATKMVRRMIKPEVLA